MKHQFLTLIIFLSTIFHTAKSQSIDSIYWDNTITPHTLYYSSYFNQGTVFRSIEQFFNGDTLFLDIVFRECNGPTVLYPYDTLISIPSSVSTPIYNFVVRLVSDSNTYLPNCLIQQRQFHIRFQHFVPLSTNDWIYHSSQHLKIWPNPIQGIGYIEATQGEMSKSIKIYNLQGQLLKTIATKTGINQQELDLRELKSGIYFIKTDTGMMKVLKE